MAEDVMVGANGCVIDQKVKDAGFEVDGEYGRMFPGLSPFEVGEAAIAELPVFATEPSP